MGSYLSGRRTSRSCDEDLFKLDVRQLMREWPYRPELTRLYVRRSSGPPGEVAVTLTDARVLIEAHYCRRGRWIQARYNIELEWTPCRFGGRRAWFRCPAPGCGRRVAVLYRRERFACRHCSDISYRSQRQSPADRANGRANKIRRRLGWIPGIALDPGGKPKGLHWKTFWRLKDEHDRLVLAVLLPWHERMRAVQENLHACMRRLHAAS